MLEAPYLELCYRARNWHISALTHTALKPELCDTRYIWPCLCIMGRINLSCKSDQYLFIHCSNDKNGCESSGLKGIPKFQMDPRKRNAQYVTDTKAKTLRRLLERKEMIMANVYPHKLCVWWTFMTIRSHISYKCLTIQCMEYEICMFPQRRAKRKRFIRDTCEYQILLNMSTIYLLLACLWEIIFAHIQKHFHWPTSKTTDHQTGFQARSVEYFFRSAWVCVCVFLMASLPQSLIFRCAELTGGRCSLIWS